MSTATPNLRPWIPETRWRSALWQMGPVAGVLVLMYAGLAPALVREWWNDPGASHGLLIPPLAAYMFWRRRGRTLAEPAATDLRGCFLSALGCLMYIAGNIGAGFFLARFSFVVVISGVLWSLCGWRRFRTLLFPLFLLATMIPMPSLVQNSITIQLQLLSSGLTAEILRLAGIPVYQDGNVIRLTTMSLGVAEACSGLRSLTSLAIAALLAGGIICGRLWQRVVLFLCSVLIALFCNILRIAGTAVLASRDPVLAMGFYHSFTGAIFFAAGLTLTLVLAVLMTRWTPRRS